MRFEVGKVGTVPVPEADLLGLTAIRERQNAADAEVVRDEVEV